MCSCQTGLLVRLLGLLSVRGIGCQLRPVRLTQFEDAVSFRIQIEAKYGQSLGKCLLELAPVLQLNLGSPFTVRLRSLPQMDGGRNENAFLNSFFKSFLQKLRVSRRTFKMSLNPGQIKPPLSHEAIGWQPALQSRGGGSIKILEVSASRGSQLVNIEIGVLDLQRIEGPLDE